jgi:hypothetical protein
MPHDEDLDFDDYTWFGDSHIFHADDGTWRFVRVVDGEYIEIGRRPRNRQIIPTLPREGTAPELR